MAETLRSAFIKSAIWQGTLDEAEKYMAAHPELALGDIHTAAITANVEAVRIFLAQNPADAIAVSEPYGGNALVYLCMSRYLRLDRRRSNHFLQAAIALLDAGADPNSGFLTGGSPPEFETALYGAAGVARDAALTKLLLEYGADPNDGEAVYHAPETQDNDVMKAFVETGKLTLESLSLMLNRKLDWHDYEGVKYLLEKGADPNAPGGGGLNAIHHALVRCNAFSTIALLLEHGADPTLISGGLTATARAAREGRSDILALFTEKRISRQLSGIDRLIAACSVGDGMAVHIIVKNSPHLLQKLIYMSGDLLARFCLSGNLPGVQQLLDIGIDVNRLYDTGDRYYKIPESSMPIHVAAWLGRPAIVQLLIKNGAQIDVPDQNGQTPLALAVRACVDSCWMERRSPDSVKALLDAGASPTNIPFPSGYPEVDSLLRNHLPV